MASEFHFRPSLAAALAVLSVALFACRPAPAPAQQTPSNVYLGFDVNEYPGDQALPALRKTFAFGGYWLNAPPGAKRNNWMGRRPSFVENNLGFLVLFNGRLDKELSSVPHAIELADQDAKSAIAAAQREGFPDTTIIFLDQEEGGRLLDEQMAYVLKWADRINSGGFRAGIYCSGVPVKEGKATITTAADVHEHQATRTIAYFIYNDKCPPSPGCALAQNPPSPELSGISFASIWQFAQSPRRREFTKSCSATYSSDGNCYPPPNAATAAAKTNGGIFLDLDSATSPDPSAAR